MSGNAKASSSSSGGVAPPGQNDTELPVSSTQKKQNDFRRYLAGQSVMKSGLTRDPKEVEKIIAEASENSKFYLREVEKDRVLGKKIERLIKVKDDMMKAANMPRLEKEANELLAQLESTRDLTQYIVHVDMDAFYANVEEKKDPSLKSKAFGVGSGVLTTASYEARKYGCRSGMAGFVAKKLCPHIIFVKPDFAAYSEASRAVREVLLEYDDNLAMAGMDEGYLNITPYMAAHEMTASEVVSHLRAEVEARIGLTISAGIAPNKMLAKICSDKNKPNGQFELAFEGKAIREFMRDLPIRRIPGIGRVAERYAGALGINVCGDAYTHRGVVNLMDRYIGFKYMMRAYLGLGSNNVEPGKREDRKSVGCERTFREKSNSEEILQMLSEIADNLEEDLKRTGYSARTVVVKYKLHSYEIFTRQCAATRYINKAEEILPLARSLLLKELPLKIRLLGIRMTGLKDLRAEEKGIQKYFKDGSTSKEPSHKARSSDDDEPIWLDSEEEPDQPFERAASNQAEESSRQRKSPRSDVITMVDDDSDEDDVEIICPVCSKLFSSKSNTNTVNQHINDCLDKQNPQRPQPAIKSPTTTKKPKDTANPPSKKRKTTKPTKPKDVFELLMKGKGSR